MEMPSFLLTLARLQGSGQLVQLSFQLRGEKAVKAVKLLEGDLRIGVEG